MHIERMHKMIECLTEKALCEFDKGIENINTCEMGQVVDMIKDLNEAEYKAVIVKSMKEAHEEEKEYDKELLRTLKAEYGEEGGRRYYDAYRYANGRFAPKGRGTRRGYEEPPYYHMYPEYDERERMRDMDRDDRGKMYYSEPASNVSGSNNMSRNYSESSYDKAMRNYTETKELHSGNTQEDKEHSMKALDKVLKEISDAINNIVSKNATTEEKNLLRTRLSTLVSKI